MLDPRALEAEIAALHAASYGWALACCGRDPDAAADVLQQAYWKVLSGRAPFFGRSPLKTWLFGVIRLTALEHRRWRFFRGRVVSTAEPVEPPSPSSPRVDRQTAELLGRALAALPDRQREVLHLVFYEGLTVKEAAAIMAVSTGTASQHYERGKARLLQILQSQGVESL